MGAATLSWRAVSADIRAVRCLPIVVAALIAACGGGSSPPPSRASGAKPLDGIAARATARTRFLLSMDLTRDEGRAFVHQLDGMIREGCPAIAERVSRIEALAGEGGGVLVELTGAVTPVDVGCWVGAEVGPDGRVGEDMRMRALPHGGVEVSIGDLPEGGGSPAILSRFLELRGGALAAVADVGPRERPMIVEFANWTYGLRFVAEDDARGAADALGRVLGAIVGVAPELAKLRVERDGALVRVHGLAFMTTIAPGSPADQLVGLYRMPTSSMLPTIEIGDHVVVLRGPLLGDVRRGDVVVVEVRGKSMFKRVIGVAGDVVTVDAGQTFVGGQPLARRIVERDRAMFDFDPETGWQAFRGTIAEETVDGRRFQIVTDGREPPLTGTWTVPAGHVFVLGDDRPNSADSRVYGPIPVAQVRGRAVVVAYSSGPDGVRWDRILSAVE